jgi:cell wall assembly regulator SMI1
MKMKELWHEIEHRLEELGCLAEMKLNAGATDASMDSLEEHLGQKLPQPVREFLAIHDGQSGHGLLFGYEFLSVDKIRDQWDMWRSIDEDAMNADCAEFMQSDPIGFIKPMYTNRLWIPLSADGGGNHIGIDYDPDALGKFGQIINYGRDEDTKRLRADNFIAFIENIIEWLNRATWNGRYLECLE